MVHVHFLLCPASRRAPAGSKKRSTGFMPNTLARLCCPVRKQKAAFFLGVLNKTVLNSESWVASLIVASLTNGRRECVLFAAVSLSPHRCGTANQQTRQQT